MIWALIGRRGGKVVGGWSGWLSSRGGGSGGSGGSGRPWMQDARIDLVPTSDLGKKAWPSGARHAPAKTPTQIAPSAGLLPSHSPSTPFAPPVNPQSCGPQQPSAPIARMTPTGAAGKKAPPLSLHPITSLGTPAPTSTGGRLAARRRKRRFMTHAPLGPFQIDFAPRSNYTQQWPLLKSSARGKHGFIPFYGQSDVRSLAFSSSIANSCHAAARGVSIESYTNGCLHITLAPQTHACHHAKFHPSCRHLQPDPRSSLSGRSHWQRHSF